MMFQGRYVLHSLVFSILLLGGSNGVVATGSGGDTSASERAERLNLTSVAKMVANWGARGVGTVGLMVLLAELQVQLLGQVLSGRELTPETQQAIREILREIGLEDADTVRLAECVESLQKVFPKSGGASLTSLLGGSRRILLMSEEAFNQLSEEEKRFLIGHEAMHIKHRHVLKAVVVGALVTICALSSATLVVRNYGRKKAYLQAGVAGVVGYLGAMVATLLVRSAVSRANERKADCQAARGLDAAAGGVALMKRLKEDPIMLEASENYKKFWWRLLMDHPTLDERIAYLQKIAEEQTVQAAAARG